MRTADDMADYAKLNAQLYKEQGRERKLRRREAWDQAFSRVARDLPLILQRLSETQKVLDKQIADYVRLKEEAAAVKKRKSAKIKRALARARREGKRIGGARRKSKVDARKLLALHERRLTQQEIARRLGISQPLVSQILRKEGKRRGGPGSY